MSTEVTNSPVEQTTPVVAETPQETADVALKHKLRDGWDLWLLCPVKEQGKKSNKLKVADSLIYEISTVEDFWAIFNNFKSPAEISYLNEKTNIILSVKGVEPKWEDPANKAGGFWSLSYPISTLQPCTPVPGTHDVDKLWDATLLPIVGGTMKNYKDITSVWMKVRAYNNVSTVTIEIWNRDSNIEVATLLGQEWMALLKSTGVDPKSYTLTYTPISDALTARNPVPTIKFENGEIV